MIDKRSLIVAATSLILPAGAAACEPRDAKVGIYFLEFYETDISLLVNNSLKFYALIGNVEQQLGFSGYVEIVISGSSRMRVESGERVLDQNLDASPNLRSIYVYGNGDLRAELSPRVGVRLD